MLADINVARKVAQNVAISTVVPFVKDSHCRILDKERVSEGAFICDNH